MLPVAGVKLKKEFESGIKLLTAAQKYERGL